MLSRAGAAGDPRPLDRRGHRQQDIGRTQRLDDSGRDRKGGVARRSGPFCGRDHQRDIAAHGRANAKRRGDQSGVIGHGLRAGRVIGEHGRIERELARDEDDERLRYTALDLDHLRERHPRMADQRELQCHSQSIAIVATLPDQVEVGFFEGEAACQFVRVGRNAKQRRPLGITEKNMLAYWHSTVPETSLARVDGAG